MIWESYYWKEELRRHAKFLYHRSTKQQRWFGASFGRVEQHAMIGCFMARRLIEAEKISTILAHKKIHLAAYPFDTKKLFNDTSKLPDRMDWHHIDRYYNVTKKQSVTLSIYQLCCQMMHTFIFIPVLDDIANNLFSILFSSDRKRGSLLYEIQTLALADLFANFADNYPIGSRSTRDQNGQWINYHFDESESNAMLNPEHLQSIDQKLETLRKD